MEVGSSNLYDSTSAMQITQRTKQSAKQPTRGKHGDVFRTRSESQKHYRSRFVRDEHLHARLALVNDDSHVKVGVRKSAKRSTNHESTPRPVATDHERNLSLNLSMFVLTSIRHEKDSKSREVTVQAIIAVSRGYE